jgi:hypothetical protein
MIRRRVCSKHCRVLVGNPTTRNPLLTLNTVAIVGFVGLYERGYTGESGRRGQGDGALEALKAWCDLGIGRTPGPSDVAEERMRPCRAQWGHDLSMGRLLEKLAS